MSLSRDRILFCRKENRDERHVPLLSLLRAREEFSFLPLLPSFSLSSPSVAMEIIFVARVVLSLTPHFTMLVFCHRERRNERKERRGERRDNVLIWGNSLETPNVWVLSSFHPNVSKQPPPPQCLGFVLFSPRRFYRIELEATWKPRRCHVSTGQNKKSLWQVIAMRSRLERWSLRKSEESGANGTA